MKDEFDGKQYSINAPVIITRDLCSLAGVGADAMLLGRGHFSFTYFGSSVHT